MNNFFSISKQLRLLVASAEGILYVYALDPVEGGDCPLVKQHRIAGTPAAVASPPPQASNAAPSGKGK